MQTAGKAEPLQSTCFQSSSAGDVSSQISVHTAVCAQRGLKLTELLNCIIMGLCFITACKEGLPCP